MRARGFLVFVILNVLVTAGVAAAVISLLGPSEDASAVVQYATVEVIITATPDPNATVPIRIITATPRPGEILSIPTGVLDETETDVTESGAAPPGATTDPDILEGNEELQATAQVLPEGCILAVLADGENPSILAERYDTDLFSILLVNGISEEDAAFLQIGQELIIPLEGCPIEEITGELGVTDQDEDVTEDDATPEDEVSAEETEDIPTETSTPDATPTPTITPTITLIPTAVDASVEIAEVIGMGDITAETVRIFNNGRLVDLTGWTLSDLDGNVYTFSDGLVFNDSGIEVFTQTGEDTPVVKYWGLDRPVWGEDDIVTLADANGVVQASFRIPSPLDLD